jgi:hypothetical protein
MKNYVRDCFCKTPEEVAKAIEDFRKSLTVEKLKNYINKLKEVRLLHLIIHLIKLK